MAHATGAISLADILAPIAQPMLRVEERLAAQVMEFDPALEEYIRHALAGQGKRLRPALALLSASDVEKIGAGHVDLGVIVEMIHIATLVHDDVMDRAEIRRNQLTARALWGVDTAVLLGDCLFAQALKLAASFPTTDICRCVAEATNTVCSGEILQTRRRFDPALTMDDYVRIVEMKTGALFAVSCDLGAYLSGATAAGRRGLREFGLRLGTAYQMYDDCLDLFGEEQRAGKSLGTDLDRGKLTLPMLIALREMSADQRTALIEEMARGSRAARKQMRHALEEQRALEQSLEIFEDCLRQARAALESAGRTAPPLLQAVEFLSQQAHALADNEEAPKLALAARS